ncbi:MAG: 6-phosphofructokinase [Bdellovibrionales bacterium]|nr:6-phosphofructokinase [Bdellovibrionales bacterium]
MTSFDSHSLKKIAVLTSGGDAPGMNAALRSVVRSALYSNIEVLGIKSGFSGLLEKNWQHLDAGSVANIIQRGGTFLKTGRCMEFLKPEYRSQAALNLKNIQVDALVCIGGDGSFTGAQALYNEHKVPVIGIPATIDNDIFGTEYTIGFDTAVNTAMQSIDKIRDTATSHDRLFIVEVMGRNSGFIATEVGLAGGAEDILIPENPTNLDLTISQIKKGIERQKRSSILITAEGQKPGRAYDLAEAIRKKSGFDAKVCVLGHVQRGGAPSAFDRKLASRMGAAAISALLNGKCDSFVGIQNDQMINVKFSDSIGKLKPVKKELIDLCRVLGR